MFQEIEEDNLRMAAKQYPSGNAYEQALNVGIIFKNAGLNPIFLLDENNFMIKITTQERMNGKLH